MTGRSIKHFYVYIVDEEVHGTVVSMGAHASRVKYEKEGISYDIMILNEDLLFLEEISFGADEEEIV
jgi:hypothetical protein